MQPSLSCSTVTLQAGNHRIPESFGTSSSSHPLPWAGTPFPSPGCSKPYPTRPGIFPGTGSPHLSRQRLDVPQRLQLQPPSHNPWERNIPAPILQSQHVLLPREEYPRMDKDKASIKGSSSPAIPKANTEGLCCPWKFQWRFLDTAPKHKSKHTHSSDN